MPDTNTLKTILIVEDEVSLNQTLTEVLTGEGYTTLSARNGKEGLDMALEHHPDLIVLDIIMPVMDGMAMLKELRKDDWGKTVSILLLTNVGDVEHMSEALEQDALDYFVKSQMELDDVVARVKQKLAEQ